VDASCEEVAEGSVAVIPEVDDEGPACQRRQAGRIPEDRAVPGLAVVQLDRGQVDHLGQVRARVQPELDAYAGALRASERGQPAGQSEAQAQEGGILDHQRPQQRVAARAVGSSQPQLRDEMIDDPGQHRRWTRAIRGGHLRVADSQPLRLVSAAHAQTAHIHQPSTGRERLVALAQATPLAQPVEQQQAHLLVRREVLPAVFGPAPLCARLDHRAQRHQLGGEPAPQSMVQPKR
jgi:hypothetical protein